MTNFIVRKVAVLGAGVMGAQIAAHCVNAKVPVVLFDLPAREGPKNGIVAKAIDNLKKLNPAPLGVKDDAVHIEAANYEEHLELLQGCDLVIEAIAERLDWKHDLYRKVAPHIAPHTIFASNTSGLPIAKLAEAMDGDLKARFCGVHFFNPPRYMHLVELIPTAATRPQILDDLEAFLTSTLGKGVVRAKDTPNFIANRVGIFGMLATIKEAEKYGIPYDVVDDLTGSKLGRAKSATFRTADVVGLDTMAHVIKTMQDTLPASIDPFAAHFATPPVLKTLVDKGALGQKSGAGFYRKEGKAIKVLDPVEGRVRRIRRQGRRSGRTHPEEEGPGRALETAARGRASASEVPVGDFPRRVSLHRGAPGDGRRHRARCRLRAALGIRLVDRPVRDLAGRRLEAGGRMGARRHRRW
jgi:3-hydroxyacyl-CoA dehydrogenase